MNSVSLICEPDGRSYAIQSILFFSPEQSDPNFITLSNEVKETVQWLARSKVSPIHISTGNQSDTVNGLTAHRAQNWAAHPDYREQESKTMPLQSNILERRDN